MIIELVGMPGSGKTALARALQSRGVVLIDTPRRPKLMLDSILFFLEHPFRRARLLARIMSHAPYGMRYGMFMNGFAVYGARYREARRLSWAGETVVLDQGHMQLLLSLPGMRMDGGTIPRPDLLVLVEAPDEVRFARMDARARRPREEFGVRAHEAWERSAASALRRVKPLLPDAALIYMEQDGMVSSEEAAASVLARIAREEPQPEAISLRSSLKTLSLMIAYALSRIARLAARTPDVVVLMYHAVDTSGWKLSVRPDIFEQQMAWLARHRTVVPLSAVVEYAAGARTLTRPAVAITFDDGYRDLRDTVLPILTRYGFPATAFVPSDLSAHTSPGARARLDERDLRALASSGLIEIGSHARTHRKLPELDASARAEEMRGSRDDLERMLGVCPRYFAYPFGARNEEAERAAEAAGYEAAFAITEGLVRQGADRYQLKRVQVDATTSALRFRLRLTSAVEINRRLVDTFVRRKRI